MLIIKCGAIKIIKITIIIIIIIFNKKRVIVISDLYILIITNQIDSNFLLMG